MRTTFKTTRLDGTPSTEFKVGEFFKAILVVENDGTAVRSFVQGSLWPQKRSGLSRHAIANTAKLLSNDPIPDTDVDTGSLSVVSVMSGATADFYAAGSQIGAKKVAPGETLEVEFQMAFLSGGGSVLDRQHYLSGHAVESNADQTSPMFTTVLMTAINVVPA